MHLALAIFVQHACDKPRNFLDRSDLSALALTCRELRWQVNRLRLIERRRDECVRNLRAALAEIDDGWGSASAMRRSPDVLRRLALCPLRVSPTVDEINVVCQFARDGLCAYETALWLSARGSKAATADAAVARHVANQVNKAVYVGFAGVSKSCASSALGFCLLLNLGPALFLDRVATASSSSSVTSGRNYERNVNNSISKALESRIFDASLFLGASFATEFRLTSANHERLLGALSSRANGPEVALRSSPAEDRALQKLLALPLSRLTDLECAVVQTARETVWAAQPASRSKSFGQALSKLSPTLNLIMHVVLLVARAPSDLRPETLRSCARLTLQCASCQQTDDDKDDKSGGGCFDGPREETRALRKKILYFLRTTLLSTMNRIADRSTRLAIQEVAELLAHGPGRKATQTTRRRKSFGKASSENRNKTSAVALTLPQHPGSQRKRRRHVSM